jgi:hypothetical protein
MDNQTRFDRIDVADLILRERLARDNQVWDEMAACYHPDSVVDVSWFKGSGAKFVELSKTAVRPGAINFHTMTPPVVNVRQDRATSETPCILRGYAMMNGVEISFEGHVRLFWRALRDGDGWLIAGMRCIYLKDEMRGRNPNRQPMFDDAKLETYRDSYRFTTANLVNLGFGVRDDLPGVDRPDLEAALRSGEQAWLQGA